MRIRVLTYLFLAVLILNCSSSEKENRNRKLKLWYDRPAQVWPEALPIGNGRLGAMVFGGITRERIQLNEESLWAGSKINNNNPGAAAHLREIQELLLDGENRKARELADKYLLGTPPRIRSYQTLGDINLKFFIDEDSVKNYRRELNLSSGITSVTFNLSEISYKRESFVSSVDDVIVIKLSSDNNSQISFKLSLERKIDAQAQFPSNNEILLTGQIIDKEDSLRGPAGKHMRFAAYLRLLCEGGKQYNTDTNLVVENADNATIILTGATDYNIDMLDFDPALEPANICAEIIDEASEKGFENLKSDHIEEHQSLFNRVELNLGNYIAEVLPTNERLDSLKNGKEDPGLIELYFQFGRYLLMNSSREPGVLPSNLQGIWNEHFEAPWNSDYHTNINLQMNYWPAEVCNLTETVLPLTKFFTELMEPGSITAREMYSAGGWNMHHVTDPFGRTGLMDGVGWGTSPLAGSWMALTFWEHYLFTQDKNYLRKSAYPIMKGSAKFILDFLIEDRDGFLVTAPSLSPENSFINPKDGTEAGMTYASTIDIQIITELFNACIEAASVLETDSKFISQLAETLKRLPPVLIGKDGTVREWIKDYDEVEPGHRHMSHLFGLHPGSQISSDTPELFLAAQKTIEKRLAHGGGHTGWSRAWIINFYARLLDGESAYEHLTALLTKSTLPNLFDNHPPFQIDGNFGSTAGIAEMLLQSHNEIIRLLPALPMAWKDGFIKGLKARGNFTIDLFWEGGELAKVVLLSNSGGVCRLQYGDTLKEIQTVAGEEFILNKELKVI